ncbi:MAG: hypothetical protein K9J12_06680 [Melioribacteraceae bacterium]|nr:hypothetical protein [Melioribacteraceae bacterium]MCF8264580.1 hypothetical protein [Melioribacteraceae bacterium]MCF8412325.1 hypothetical protein [Melioribacteraceae bacterium]
MKSEIIKIVVFTFLIFGGISQSIFAQNDTLYVSSWNLQNLFDTVDDPEKNDEDFLPNGNYKWDDERLNVKLSNMGNVIRFMNNGKGPDILGVQEVENKSMVDSLVGMNFKDKNYRVAYEESPDNRGIDNGLVFNADKLELLRVVGHEVILPDKYPTRLILQTDFKYLDDTLHVFVNHWPSRRGGEEKSAPNRATAAKKLKSIVDSLFAKDTGANIIIMGDFNDEPNNMSIELVLGAEPFNCSESKEQSKLYNLAYENFDEGWGTYLYQGDWNMLDQIIISNSPESYLKYICSSFEIVKPDYMVQKQGRYKDAALPTYGGRTYLGGYSDHYPVSVKFVIK